MGWWSSLGDDELAARLSQRGVADKHVRDLVDDRDDPTVDGIIGEFLDG